MSLVFRDDPPDRAAFFALFESTGWNEEYRLGADDIAEAVEGSVFLRCAYDGDRLVGVGRVVGDGRLHALIVDLIVDPAWRGRGLGSSILRALVERCRARGIPDIQLFSATGKAPFYEGNGFVRRPPDAPGMDFRPNEESE